MPDYIGTSNDEALITLRKTGDSFPRLAFQADGDIKLGNGTFGRSLNLVKKALLNIYPEKLYPVPQPVAVEPTQSVAYGASTIASPRYWRFGSGNGTDATVSKGFYTLTVGSEFRARDAGGYYGYVSNLPPYTTAILEKNSDSDGSDFVAFEFIHSGDASFELNHLNYAQHYRVFVDGDIVTAGTTTDAYCNYYYTTGSDFADRYHKFTFASVAPRHIRIELYNPYLQGIVTGPNGNIAPVPNVKPKVLCVGDSFLGGSNGSSPIITWGAQLCNFMGWNVHSCGRGGAGYTQPGSGNLTFVQCLPYFNKLNFDAIVVCGGYNDGTNITEDAIYTFLSTARSMWPHAPIFVTLNFSKGVEAQTYASLTQIANANTYISNACKRVQNCYAINIFELPNGTALGISTTVSSSTSIGATTLPVTTAAPVPYGSVIEIGSGTTRERRTVKSYSSGFVVQALTYAHSAGETVTVVGMPWTSGSGQVGTTTGWGTCDTYVYSDGIHPTRYGSEALGYVLASEIQRISRDAIFA